MTQEQKLIPTRKEIIYLCMAVKDTYLGFDREDFCQEKNTSFYKVDDDCKCYGCVQYNNLIRAYNIAKKYFPKILNQ